ncbi:hypothetical protein Ccar_16645 [Clostridium carboxidivorans P7]|uniref:hypothetical protein n=1 Tax=Clostridium carboxidivorans TaxID=217159 RepID=UPI00064E9B40|nr:hypothetical protein [Clostridium carboxidivorans]AKN32401.1 hypothetical protein Ccar_16645 [Clostridium carboxidivorans P7]
MIKQTIKLTLVEMYAIKHALQFKMLNRRAVVSVYKDNPKLKKGLEKLEKDIAHEEVLIKMFESEIRDFREKNNIK